MQAQTAGRNHELGSDRLFYLFSLLFFLSKELRNSAPGNAARKIMGTKFRINLPLVSQSKKNNRSPKIASLGVRTLQLTLPPDEASRYDDTRTNNSTAQKPDTQS